MNIIESLAVAFEGIMSNKMRSLLTMLGIIIGVAAVITMLAITTGAKVQMMSQIQKMGTNVLIVRPGQATFGGVRGGAGSRNTLTLEDSEAIMSKCSSVVEVAPEVSSNAQVKYTNNNTNTSIMGVTPEYLSVRNFDIQSGSFFKFSDVKSMSKVAVIGATTSTDLFGGRDPIGKYISIQGIRFKVIGLLKSKGSSGGFMDMDDMIMIPITTAMKRVFGIQYVRAINVQAVSMESMDQAISQITKVLRRRHRIYNSADDDFSIRSQADIMEMANESSKTFTFLLAGIASVSLLVGGIGVMNIMLVSVKERTREIGIRKALGARAKDIQRQFLIEAIVLSTLGGIIGVLFGIGGAKLIGSFSTFSVMVSLGSILLSFGFSAAVGVFFGYYPARSASKLDPIEALRYE